MRTANVVAVIESLIRVYRVHIFIKRTSTEVFNLGTSSFLLNYNKGTLLNPELIWGRLKYDSKDYDHIWISEVIAGRCVGIQVTCHGKGQDVSESYERICTVKWSFAKNKTKYFTANDVNLSWRMLDTATLTPEHGHIDVNYIVDNLLTFK